MENNPSAIDNVATLKESLETVSRSGDICVEKDGEYIIDDVERLTFECKAVLGKGGDAVVEKVQHRITKAIFAKKVIQFPHKKAKGRDQAKGRYYNEVAIIRKLKAHPHMIELFATYMTPQSGGLILFPAADQGDLKQYLEHYVDALDDSTTAPLVIARMTTVMEKTFGCLSSGLAYMHAMGIRHKDIKPANILIHKGVVVYTDFGASKDTLRERECTTEGRPDFLTRKYSAPEVLEHEKRNFAADVFSLGCVFVEVLLRLCGLTEHEDLKAEGYSGIMDALHTLLPSAGIPSKLSCLREIIIAMTAREAKSRPDSAKIATDICFHDGLSCLQCRITKDQVQPLQSQPSAPEPPAPESPAPEPRTLESPTLESSSSGPSTPDSLVLESSESESPEPPGLQPQPRQPKLQQPRASQLQPLQSLAQQSQPQIQQPTHNAQAMSSQLQFSQPQQVLPQQSDPFTSQTAWNHHFQRYLQAQFHEQYQRWFWNHHDGQSWVFFDWVPLETAPRSLVQPQVQRQIQPQPQVQLQPGVNQFYSDLSPMRFDSKTLPASRHQGNRISGSWDGTNVTPDSHYERLDPTFYVRDASFFIEGRVFSVLFSEATGGDAVNVQQKVNNATDYNDSVSIVKYGEMVHTQVRRFIVVKHKREFCFAVPILTYQGQGTKKVVSPGKHAIAYSHGYDPRLLPNEPPLAKHAICIVMNNGENPLVAASRIYFGIHHPVQYNVKVKDLGMVHQDWLPTFIRYWHIETLSDSQQPDDSTEKAA